jgi:uncharacterized protein
LIYFDTSALVKLIFDEAKSAALAEWLALNADLRRISSDLATMELLRTCHRVDEEAVESASRVLGGIDLLPIDRAIVEKAASLSPADLRSLYAVHLASALSVKEHLTAFVAYDRRLCSAAADAGIAVLSLK